MPAARSPFLDALRSLHLLDAARLDVLARDPATAGLDQRALVEELLRRGWLTPYQAGFLRDGRGRELVLGAYVLLEPLGEGGMGQVFRAWNWKLGRVVALKVVRKDRLDRPDAIDRFRREIRAAGRLSHPNVVHALDAGEEGGVFYFAMEIVQGADLTRVVRERGPLPVARACEYVRQAALGLHHAHERGLVHRDVKPSNLLLTQPGEVVKVLDLGLARLNRRSEAGGLIAAYRSDGTVRVMDAETAAVSATLPGRNRGLSSVKWSPDGGLLALSDSAGRVAPWGPKAADPPLERKQPGRTGRSASGTGRKKTRSRP